jgi:transcriptional regulator with XRE-family HTH domain
MLRGLRCPQGRYFKAVKGYSSEPRTIGDHVKKRRLDLGLRQKEVAACLGLHFNTLQLWERGIGDPGVKLLPGIIRFLGYFPLDCDPTPGGRISFLRRCCGITQEELAARIGCNPGTLWRWESNHPALSRRHFFVESVLHKEMKRLGIRGFVLGSDAD